MGDGRYCFVYIKVSEVPWESYNTVLKIGVFQKKKKNNLDGCVRCFGWMC